MIKFTSFPKNENWVSGEVDNFQFEAKLFDTGSRYGIENGRVSKLSIRSDNKLIVNYCRGWDIKPKIRHEKAFNEVMSFLESSPKRFENS